MRALQEHSNLLAARLPDGVRAINLCQNRVNLLVGLSAVGMKQGTSIFPNDKSSATILSIMQEDNKTVLLDDDVKNIQKWDELNLPVYPIDAAETSEIGQSASVNFANLLDPNTVGNVQHFTSGTTGTARIWSKSWQEIWGCGQKTYQRLADEGGLKTGDTMIATVPPQHMYGFENSIIVPLLGDLEIFAGQPFYPSDIQNACKAASKDVCLITTPFHLRTLIESGVHIDNISLLISATAPLSPELASRAESCFKCRVVEIYGSTETGVIATRLTAREKYYTLLAGVELISNDDGALYQSDHLQQKIQLGDYLNFRNETSFEIIGRNADMVKVAGKRASLAALNELLLSIPAVKDGVFFVPPLEKPTNVQRPILFWVADQAGVSDIRKELLELIDPVFVPRHLIEVDALPRDPSGKLRQADLLDLWQNACGRRE